MRSPILNGNFEHWTHRDFFGIGDTLPLVDVGGYWADRFGHRGNYSKVSPSRQQFNPNQCDVPGNPRYFYRIATAPADNPNAYSLIAQDIPRVDCFAGQLTTLSFWMRANVEREVCLEWQRDYGGFGFPGYEAGLIPGLTQKIDVTTEWKNFKVLCDIPMIGSHTISDKDDDYVTPVWWLEAGSNFNDRCCNLGQHAGIFDLANVTWLVGDLSRCHDPFSLVDLTGDAFECMKYARMGEAETALFSGDVISGASYWSSVNYGVPMRCKPTYLTITNQGQSRFPAPAGPIVASTSTKYGFNEWRVANSTGPGFFQSRWLADSEFHYEP